MRFFSNTTLEKQVCRPKSGINLYPFGSPMPGRQFNSSSYRYGFNGQEKVDEIAGNGNSYTAEFWQYDSRLGRRWNIDPAFAEKPWMSPYHAFSNKPILNIDPNGANDDDYLIKSDGKIEVKKTDDKTDNFKYQGADGKITDIGTFNKNDKGYVNITSGGPSYNIDNTKESKRFMDPKSFAAFIGASMNYYNETGLQIQVNQFSNAEGGHSKHGGNGQYIDYRYTSTNGNKNEAVWSQNDNFDKGKSQFMVNELVKFGYNSTPSNLRGGKYSILTQDGFSTSPALDNTGYYTGHHHHVHIQNYDKAHIQKVTNLSIEQGIAPATNYLAPSTLSVPTYNH